MKEELEMLTSFGRGTTQHLELDQPGSLGDLLIMVINHLLTGMILQVHLVGSFNPFEKYDRQIGSFPPGFGVNIKHVWNQYTQ